MASVGLRPEVQIIEGVINPADFELLKSSIERNRATLISYWDGDIDTFDAIAKLVKI